jgi:asparagine synthase (glutamine-hydrolysing)
MCGIFYFQTLAKMSLAQLKTLQENFILSAHRGPDKSVFMKDDTRAWGFHRLSINGMDPSADQPFHLKNCRLICNGEIYNFRSLIQEFALEQDYKSGSDCEIIIHLYRKIGIHETIRRLDGVFGFVLHDYLNGMTYVARDPVGVRSLFIGVSRHDGIFGGEHSDLACVSINPDHYALCIASELKSIHALCDTVVQFPAGSYMEYAGEDSVDGTAVFRTYYDYAYLSYVSDDGSSAAGALLKKTTDCSLFESQLKELRVDYSYPILEPACVGGGGGGGDDDGEAEILRNIRELFTKAVVKRLMSERPVGCLLSGGLDSSLVTAIVARELKRTSPDTVLNTYSIGLEGSVDLIWGRRVAEYLGTCHHEVALTENDFLDAIYATVYQTESYCTTTIRASVGNYLVSKYIQQQTDDVVIYCGDMSDEIFGSYRGFLKAPSDADFQRENERMIRDVRFFDLLRSDKSISGAGLEARVPFADKEFLTYVMRIPPRFKRFTDERIEKYLLRKAFQGPELESDSGRALLPNDVLWRRKEAFSDGVSSADGRTWVQMVKEYADRVITDVEYNDKSNHIHSLYNPPYDKESFYYRRIFETLYDGRGETIPYYWRHPFCEGVLDPSARLLSFYVTDAVNSSGTTATSTE